MNRTEKAREVEQLTDQFGRMTAAIFAEYRGLSVAQMTSLRAKARGVGAKLRVVKNRLAKRALKAAQLEGVERYFAGPTAMVASAGDAAALAKVLVEFAGENEQWKLKGGYVEGKVVEPGVLKTLAHLPPRGVLLAQLMGSLKAPMSQFVRVVAAVPRQLVLVLKALEGTKS